MRKKIYSLFAIMFLLFTCVFASACGDKYKKMEFKVSYAFSEDADDWFDGTNGISLNYGGKYDEFKLEEDSGSIYIKIDVVGVKAKHIDTITVSPQSFAGLKFSNESVKENEIFELPISGIVDTTLKLYENNSRKSHSVKLDIYRSLEKIEVDTSIKPALMNLVGSKINLNQIDNLLFNPYPSEKTNQEEVVYSVVSIGSYNTNGTYVASRNETDSNKYISVEDGVLKIINTNFFNSTNTVIRVKATSVYHDGSVNPDDLVAAEFDVYVVPADIVNPVLKYENENGNQVVTAQNTKPHVNLYENGKTDLGFNYSTATLYVDTTNLTGPYAAGVNTIDGKIGYDIAVYVRNSRGAYERYIIGDEKYQTGINGLIVTNPEAKKYTFAIANRLENTNGVKFAYVLDGLDFSASSAPDASTYIRVAKSVLPNVITVNNTVDLNNGDVQRAVIYGTKSSSYKGLQLKLTANPNDDLSRVIELNANDGLLITDGKNPITSANVLSGDTIFVKFKDNVNESKTLLIRTLKSPGYYNGSTAIMPEYIEVRYELEKLVTADAFKFVAPVSDGVNTSYEETDSFVFDAHNNSSMFVKVYYTGSELDRQTVTINSNNENILFANNSRAMTLDDSSVSRKAYNTDDMGRYDIYEIPVKQTNVVTQGKLTVVAGDGSLNVSAEASAYSVYLMSDEAQEGLHLKTNSVTVKQFNNANEFALALNQFAEFNVLDGNNLSNTIDDIEFINFENSEFVDFVNNNNAINITKVNSSSFNVVGKQIGTKVFKIKVHFYTLDDAENIIKGSKEINVQMAVFNAIGNISVDPYNNLIGYINNYFTETTTTEINFDAVTATYGNPATNVKFYDFDNELSKEEKGASQVSVSINEYNSIVASGKINIYFECDGSKIDLLQSSSTILSNGENYYLNGKIVVELTDKVEDIKEINLTIKALRYDLSTSVLSNIIINIADVVTADGISVSSKNFIQTTDEDVELRLSFIETIDGGYVEDNFSANIRFENNKLTANTLKFEDIETALTYMLYKYDFENENWVRYFDDFLTVTIADGKVNVRAYKDNGGGYFKLVLATKDSFNNVNKNPFETTVEETDFNTKYAIKVRISDGSVGAEYIVTDVKTLQQINYNLNSQFVLGADIVINDDIQPIGSVNNSVVPFGGGFNGQFIDDVTKTNYSITFNINKTINSDKSGTLAGLFTVIGETATIKNLTLNVSYVDEFENADTNGLKIGALAGVNNGNIENVIVNLTKQTEISFEEVSAGAIDFGGIVALNNANIKSSHAYFEKELKITSIATLITNVGLVAGTNNGTISGGYLGKKSLDNYIFDVIANINFINNSTIGGNEHKVGAVVGYNTATIQNILVGGNIVVGKTDGDEIQTGYLGGVAGSSLNGAINTVTALSLNLTSNSSNVNVAGIVGSTNGTTIDHAKFVSVITVFDILGEIAGQINGNVVAGITSSSTNGSISASSVESFVNTYIDKTDEDKEKTFPTLNGLTIYGIANVSGTNVNNCFVNANVNKAISDTNSYFMGKVGDDLTVTFESTAKITVGDYVSPVTINVDSNLTDIYIDNENGTYTKAESFEDGKPYVQFNHGYWLTYAKGLVSGTWIEDEDLGGFKNGNWRLEQNHNFIYINGVKFYFPYIVEDVDVDEVKTDYQAIMIVAPQDITAEINQKYITNKKSVYIKHFNIADYNIKESAIVNYFNGAGDENNAYKLFSDKNEDGTSKNNGLLDASILPSDAQGGFAYRIIGDGYKYAYINYQNEIVFTGVSGKTAIVVEIYSVFNTKIKFYVAFYSQAGVTKINLKSSSLYAVETSDYRYETSLYTGDTNKVITMFAENKLNNKNYPNMLDSHELQQYLIVEVDKISNSKIIVDSSSYKNITMKIDESKDVVVGDKELLTFRLLLDKSYFGNNLAQNIVIGKVTIQVYLFNSATGIEIVGADKEITTFDEINFHTYVTTDWINNVEKTPKISYVNTDGEIVLTNDENNDSIIINLEVVEGEAQIEKVIDAVNVEKVKNNEPTINHFAELFNVEIIRTLYKDLEKKPIGYIYDIMLELIDEHNYRYIEENIKFNIIVSAFSNLSCNNKDNPLEIVIKPAVLSTARIENYAVKTLDVNTTFTNIVTADDVETSIIEPGSLGNVMMIYLEPTYSNVVSAKIKTSQLPVPSLGRDVQMNFTQLVYNEEKGAFTTIYTSTPSVQQGDTLELQLVSSVDKNNKTYYNGIILLYIQLEKFAGLEDSLTATLEVETSNGKTITRTRSLLTTYLPGTSMEYDSEKKINDTYLIQKGTSNNEVKIKIYGYQFNSNPDISFAWELPALKDEAGNIVKNGDDVIYGYWDENGTEEINGKKYNLWDYQYVGGNAQKITDGTNTYLIGNYISYYLINNYDEVEYNKEENSYTLTLKLNVASDIPAAFRVSATLSLSTKDGQLYTSNDADNTLIFSPTEYIINSVYVNDLSNNKKNIAINKTNSIDLKFTTDSETNDLSDVIYTKLITYLKSKDETLSNFEDLFKFYKNGEHLSFASANIEEFEVNIVNDKILTIMGISKFSALISINLDYEYVPTQNGLYELQFTANQKSKSFTFTLEIYASDEDNETPIYSADEIFDSATGSWNLIEGGYYVLMNDIELENVVPITTKIGSFDGNNRTISIKSFATNVETADYGLFGQIGEYTALDTATGLEVTKQTILKNVIVNYGKFNGTLAINNVNSADVTFGGLVAKNNNGVIYNCDVMNLDVTSNKKQVDIIVASDSNVTFGGLVGENSGVITNSRVGREGYTRITATKTTESSVYVPAKGLAFNIFNKETEGNDNNQFTVVAGGFVGKNLGTIATSYLANTDLINYSTNETINKTSGFAGENSGTISYSYAKADDNTINSSNPYATGYGIENKGNGIVAGFVYTNSGEINNSYANLELKTKSAYISGFVYDNSGVISESYAAATMNSGSVDSKAEQPFIGVNSANVLMNTATIENSYYLMRSSIDIPYYYEDRDVAQGLNEENFQNSEYLTGFVFVLSNSKQEREQGVWSYYSLDNEYRILPELMNTNNIAHSYRYVVDSEATTKVYTNAISYAEGSKNNPYIIANAKDYNEVFVENNTIKRTGYIRFINNIDFENDESAIKTRTNYTLGDKNNLIDMTSVDGNGMTISGIYLDVGEAVVEKIGLFAEIENAYIKNLNLEFAIPTTNGQFSTTTVQYSGGLAGTIENSAIINVKLNGANTTLTGNNFVGGVAGLIKGNSLIYGIETNLSVKVKSSGEGLYYNKTDYNALNRSLTTHQDYDAYLKTLSYAGGIAGVLDLTSRYNIEHNVQYIDVRGDQMASKAQDGKQEANILAEFAGGVAGYANESTQSFKLRYFTGNNDLIRGNTAVGGLFGVTLGSLTASQVTANEDVQFKYDTTIGEYIIDLKTNKQDNVLDTQNIGNTSLLEGYKYVGGLVGVALNSNILAGYAKVGVKSGAHVGGLIGLSVASGVQYSYAIPFINDSQSITYVGGLIGSSYGIELVSPTRNSNITEYETLLKYKNKNLTVDYTDIMFTFSTVIVEDVETSALKNATLDYIVANYMEGDKPYITSNQDKAFVYVYAGPVSYSHVEVSNNTASTNNASSVDLYRLFNTSEGDQVVAFQEVFSGWATIKYWTLKEEKYFPLLNNEAVDNFIDIDDEIDLSQLASNPEGKFRVVNDITISPKTANWIVSGTFKGVLIGQIPGEDRLPKITIEGLTPNRANSTGFFQATMNASISNLEFVWKSTTVSPAIDISQVTDGGNNVTMVSGLTCDDDGSLISNVEVRVTSDGGYLVNDNSHTITGFGGIVGYSTNTNILGSKFIGKVNATLTADKDSSSYVGGIIAKAETTASKNNLNKNKKATVINSSYVGARAATSDNGGETTSYPTTQFEIIVEENTTAYIGGIVGYADNISIASSGVGGTDYTDGYKNINFDIELDNASKNIYAGGIAGLATNGSILNCDALTNITTIGETTNDEANINQEAEWAGQTIHIGGLAGKYGLSADAGLTTGIKGSNTKTNITTFKVVKDAGGNVTITDSLKTHDEDTILVSAGVAELATNSTMQQCLFTGEINTENSSIANMYAGGAVAKITAGQGNIVDLEEITADVQLTVGSSDTKQIYAGGLIGNLDNAEISYSASLGRVIPVTSNDADIIYGGGLIGKATKVSINNSYTMSSIIADSIASKAIANLNMGALIGGFEGNVDTTVTNTFYSSDYGLFADENYTSDGHALGTNISAATMLLQTIWHNDLMKEEGVTNNIWNKLETSNIPYLSSLSQALRKFGVHNPISGTSNYNYVEGSAMNPVRVTSSEYNFDNETYKKYTYYFLYTRDNLALQGSLNGFLLGADKKYTISSLANSGEYYGIIPEIQSHSVVSNLHVTLPETLTVSNITGIIAGLNKGVIFNSSVSGAGITIEGTGASVGLIAGRNDGLISYSYSNAEIISTTAATAGIVNTNAGKLLSNYFIGYIEAAKDSSPELAGIVIAVQGENHYVYNNYMTGVINGGKDESDNNNFSATSNLLGSNNFIDSYSDIDFTGIEGVLTSISTAELMSKAGGLDGEWYFTVENGKFKTDPSGVIGQPDENGNVNNLTFGYNYNYPIYRFNKQTIITSELTCNEWTEQLFTGTGLDSTNKADRYTNLNSGGDKYANAFKIPHLGVLSSVQGLLGADRNYVLIYDIDGASKQWKAVGSVTTETSKVNNFEYIAGFQGVFITNKYFNHSADEDDKICTIQNLSVDGLFENITSAYFGDINFGSFTKLSASGALGKTIIGNTQKTSLLTETEGNAQNDTDNADVIVNNVTFLKDSKISAEGENNYFGSLFGDVKGNLQVDKFISSYKSDSGSDASAITLDGDANTTVGLIAGKSGGTITLSSGKDSTYYALFDGNKIAGGLVGEMYGGTINSNNNSIYIQQNKDLESSNMVGGVVGKTSGTASIKNAKIVLYSPLETIEFNMNSFGGIVGEVNAETSITDCSIAANHEKVAFFVNTSKDNYIGLIAGLQKATINVKGFEVVNENEKLLGEMIVSVSVTNEANYKEDNKTSGIGAFVGAMDVTSTEQNPALNITKYTPFAMNFVVTGVPNLGGIVGYYTNSGIINIPYLSLGVGSENKNLSIALNGTTNVGGLFGWANAVVNASTFTSKIDRNNTIQNLLTGISFATINVGQTVDVKNVGGLFGKYSGDELSSATNRNAINIVKGDSAYNVGGVAGLFTGATASELTNSSSFGYQTDNVSIDTEQITNGICKTVNVGGIFGLVDVANLTTQKAVQEGTENSTITLTNLINGANVIGYQNVGGLVGYMCGGNGENAKTIKISNPASIGANLKWENGIIGSGYTDTENVDNNIVVNIEKALTGNVTGVLNVGGAVGYADENVTISQIYSNASVYGNASVGGLVGFVKGATLTNNYIATTAIKGIYYNYNYKVSNGSQTTDETASYIPTSVGGFVGSNVSGNLTNNIINGVQIKSTDEGTNAGAVISTISNYMVDFSVNNANDSTIGNITNSTKAYSLTESNDKAIFNDITTGYGGFIGSTSISCDSTNAMVGIDINAQLGVNVGTYYGVYVNNAALTTPALYGDVDVDGAYNIGGLFGYVHGNASGIKNENLTGTATIKLQSRSVGMYVGGLIGKTDNAVTDLSIKSITEGINIKIDTEFSYYIGGLIGKAVVSDNNKTISGNVGTWTENNNGTPDNYDDDKYILTSNSDNILLENSDSMNNFGGLIGMLKVLSANSGGYSVNVQGKHNYAFTINTIENSNYYDGDSTTDVNEYDNAIYLIAQAYYVNLDTFNIVGSLNESLYDGVQDTNPLDTNALGWSKEYTAFRMMQRCIPASNNNGAEWDSIGVIFDAGCITHVATVKSVFNRDSVSYTPYKETEAITLSGDHIVYTVYEEGDGSPKMYSAMGIASLYEDSTGSSMTSDNSKYLDLPNGSRDADRKPNDGKFDIVNAYKDGDGVIVDVKYYLECGHGDLLYFNYSNHFDYKDDNYDYTATVNGSGDIGKIEAKAVHYEKTLYYPINNYYNKGTDTNANFTFEVVFANNSIDSWSTEGTSIKFEGINPQSGSIFEVYGYNDSQTKIMKFGSQPTPKKQWYQVVGEIAGLVLCFVPILGALGKIAKGAKWVLKLAKIAKVLKVIAQIAGIAGVMVGIVGSMVTVNSVSSTFQDVTYFNTYNQNLGYISSKYSRQITYSNGKLQSSTNNNIVLEDRNGTYQYIFYSNTRPSDYLTKSYFYYTNNKVESNNYLSYNDASLYGFDKYSAKTDLAKDNTNLESKNGIACNKYIYYQGGYYINVELMTVYKMPTQYFDSSLYDSESFYALIDSKYYTYGYYDVENDEYYISNTDGNNADEYNNVKESSHKSKEYTINGVAITNVEQTDERTFVYVEEMLKDGDDKDVAKMFGYDKINKLYFTANGNKEIPSSSYYATFNKTTTQPQGINGVDYITLKENKTVTVSNPENGATITKTEPVDVYYVIGEMISGSGTDYSAIKDTIYDEGKAPASINVNMYPSALTNPYINKETGVKYRKEINGYFIDKSIAYKEEFIELTKTDVKYFYFDGGYIVKEIAGEKVVFMHKQFQTDEETFIYDEFGKSKKIKMTEISNYLNRSEDYYINNVKDEDGSLLVMYKIKNQYYCEDNKLYLRNDNFSIMDNGLLAKQFLVPPGTSENYQNEFNYHKYAYNTDVNLYTRFKYVGNDLNSSTYADSKYCLIPSESNYTGDPNHSTTYFSESVKVTIGCNQNNQYLTFKEDGQRRKIGAIKVS